MHIHLDLLQHWSTCMMYTYVKECLLSQPYIYMFHISTYIGLQNKWQVTCMRATGMMDITQFM